MVYASLIAWKVEGLHDCLIEMRIYLEEEKRIYRRRKCGHAKTRGCTVSSALDISTLRLLKSAFTLMHFAGLPAKYDKNGRHQRIDKVVAWAKSFKELFKNRTLDRGRLAHKPIREFHDLPSDSMHQSFCMLTRIILSKLKRPVSYLNHNHDFQLRKNQQESICQVELNAFSSTTTSMTTTTAFSGHNIQGFQLGSNSGQVNVNIHGQPGKPTTSETI